VREFEERINEVIEKKERYFHLNEKSIYELKQTHKEIVESPHYTYLIFSCEGYNTYGLYKLPHTILVLSFYIQDLEGYSSVSKYLSR
jgi:hypothetical protein